MPRAKPLRCLLTNDDGLDAPGLAALEDALPDGSEKLVFAPERERSACSHQVTTDRAFRVRRVGRRRYAVGSWPADCVRVALHEFASRFDWVLAGINHGANLGADVFYSGTVAAAREAALFGLPAIAVSHYRDRVLSAHDWSRAAAWTRGLLPWLLERPPGRGEIWNVNLPSLPSGPVTPAPEWVECRLDPSPLRLAYSVDSGDFHYEGVYSERERQPGRDVDVCFRGAISVSRLSLG